MTAAELVVKLGVTGGSAVTSTLGSVASGVKNLGDAILRTAGVMKLLDGLQDALNQATGVDAALAYDSQVRGLGAYSKSAAELTAQLARLKEIAKLPGLGLGEVRQGVLSMEAAGLSAQQAESVLMNFGNALALVGKGKSDLQGVTLAITQIATKGKLMGQELNQLAERTPQVRQALIRAFGTADTEEIQKMGISGKQAIMMITNELAKLPKMSSSALTTIENLQDALTEAFRPIGTGLLDIMRSSEGGVMRVIDLVAEAGRQIGEVFSAVGASGVIQDVFESLLSNAGVANFQEAMINVVATILAYISRIPVIWEAVVHDMGAAWAYVKESIIYYFGEAMDWIEGKWKELINNIQGIMNPFAGFFGLPQGGVLGNGGGGAGGAGGAKRLAPIMAPMMTPGAFQMTGIMAGIYGDSIKSKLGPQGLPNGIIFGGGLGEDGQQTVKDTLGKIEKNTKDAADSLSLRKETLGGGKLGALGASVGDFTPSGEYGAFTGGDFFSRTAPIQAGTDFERAMRRMMRDEARKAGTPGGLNRRF